jgi:hypothetical protein
MVILLIRLCVFIAVSNENGFAWMAGKAFEDTSPAKQARQGGMLGA